MSDIWKFAGALAAAFGLFILFIQLGAPSPPGQSAVAAGAPDKTATSEIPDYSSGDTAENIWHVGPNEAYYPSTYCTWNRSGLPDAQAEICAGLDQKQNVLKPNWRTLTADNGSIYKIDVNSIARFNTGSAEIAVYKDEGGGFNPMHLTKFLFDCHGHYQDEANMERVLYAP
ncbi:MAG TPA: hypothetical protein VG889_20685 [Rhizomicrobium sp.]|nr:hypothetical protein [Rhizomicrobium sp.]